MRTRGPSRRGARPGPPRAPLAAAPAALAVVQVVGTVAASHHGGPAGPWGSGQPVARALDGAGVALLLLGPAALLLRRRWPSAAQAVAAAAVLAYLGAGYPQGPVWASLVVATVRAAAWRRWASYAVLVVTAALALLVLPRLVGEPAPPAAVAVGVLAWVCALVAVAEWLRQRRTAQRAAVERAAEAARGRAQERRRRASDERLAVARELHDVLGHSLSMINVQSGVALELMDDRPEAAREALVAIKAASRDALVEVHGVLAALRAPAGGDSGAAGEGGGEGGGGGAHEGGAARAPRAPAASVTDLDALVARARAAGLEVTTQVQGAPGHLPAAVDLAAARIVQEALTNVARHAGGAAARVLLSHEPRALRVLVDDDGPAPAPAPAAPAPPGPVAGAGGPRGGSGLPGMRERAAALGGDLVAGPRPGGGFRVEAVLPLAPGRPAPGAPASTAPGAPSSPLVRP